jgi:hypothetical protein
MPRIKGAAGPYRIFFTSFDCNEPPHVHVERENKTCKFCSNHSASLGIRASAPAS